VAEVFIGADFTDIRHDKEFEISPQGEWVDFEIDLSDEACSTRPTLHVYSVCASIVRDLYCGPSEPCPEVRLL
jgi:hypothetical protein